MVSINSPFTVLAIALMLVIVVMLLRERARQKSDKHLYRQLNEGLSRVHDRINNSLDYSRAIVEYFEPRHAELLVDDSNRLFLPTLPVQPAKESLTDVIGEKALSSRERNSLLAIIAVLCKDAGHDYKKHAKTAVNLQNTAAGMGLSIGETTIENHLKKIPDALASRMK